MPAGEAELILRVTFFLIRWDRAVKYDVETARLKDNGVFWIDFASIFQYFRNVFMNWNPALFSYRYT